MLQSLSDKQLRQLHHLRGEALLLTAYMVTRYEIYTPEWEYWHKRNLIVNRQIDRIWKERFKRGKLGTVNTYY